MKYLKDIAIITGIMLLFILLFTLIITTLNYFDLFGKGSTSIFKIIIMILSYFIGGILIGKKSSKKGWLEGLKFGLIFSLVLFLFNILGLQTKIDLKLIFYDLILITSCIFGSMIGINKKS